MPPFQAHWLRLRASAHPTEDPARVEAAVRFLAGLEEDAFRQALETTRLEGQHGGVIQVLEVTLKRSRDIRSTLARLLTDTLRAMGAAEAAARTDEEGVFYLRFDKQAAYEARIEPTRGEDAVQVRLRPQVHPATPENATAAVLALLEGRTA